MAACSFLAAPAVAQAGPDRVVIQVTPAGAFTPSDRRPLPVPAWRIDDAAAARVIERFRARQRPLVIDYEHQTLHKERNGQPAPAAGWYQDLAWRPGEGLFATVELTARAREAINAGEYRYFSPVFRFDQGTGEVLEILMGALTNDPGIDGLQPLQLLAAATFGHRHNEDPDMDKHKTLLSAVIAALALADDASDETAIAALTALPPQLDELRQLRQTLDLSDQVTGADAVAACTRALAARQPDPAQYVPVAVAEGLRGQIAALTARIDAHDQAALTALVDQALEAGVLVNDAERDWALNLGGKDPALLRQFLDTRQPLAALTRTQTGGREPPAASGAEGLTADELAVCTATGIAPEVFAATRAAAGASA